MQNKQKLIQLLKEKNISDETTYLFGIQIGLFIQQILFNKILKSLSDEESDELESISFRNQLSPIQKSKLYEEAYFDKTGVTIEEEIDLIVGEILKILSDSETFASKFKNIPSDKIAKALDDELAILINDEIDKL